MLVSVDIDQPQILTLSDLNLATAIRCHLATDKNQYAFIGARWREVHLCIARSTSNHAKIALK